MTDYDIKYADVLDLIELAIKQGKSLTAISYEERNTSSYIRKRRNTINANIDKFSESFIARYNELIGRYNNTRISICANAQASSTIDDDSFEPSMLQKTIGIEVSDFNTDPIEILYDSKTYDDSIYKSIIDAFIQQNGFDLENNYIKKVQVAGALNKVPRVSLVLEPKNLMMKPDFRAMADDFFKHIENKLPNKKPIVPFYINKNVKSDILAMPAIFDEHFGKLTHFSETGEEFNIDIATERHFNALEHFISEMVRNDVSKVFYPVGNDLFNSDTPQNTTTAGTPQDEQLRWKKTFKLVESVFYKSIDMLATHFPVDIYTVPGNHDVKNTFTLGRVLKAYYRHEEKAGTVTVNKDGFDERARRYYKYGKNAIGLSHGDGEKIKNVPSVSLNEFKQQFKDWYEAEFHYHFLGHLHHEKQFIVNDQDGFKMFHVPSMTGTDWWHSYKGYSASRKMSQMFLFDKEKGLMNTCNFYV